MPAPNVTGAYWTPALTQTAVQAANYTASANQIVPVSTAAGNVTVTLPNAPPAGTIAAVKMVTQGGTNTVTISSIAGDVFNKPGGPTSMTLTLLGQGMILEYQAGTWMVLSDDLPLSQLDGRYLLLAGGTMSGVIAMGANKITGLANGTAASDAAAFGQVPVTGGTSFAPVTLATASASAAQTANLLCYYTVSVPAAVTLTGLVVANGATATGNILAGVYNAAGSSLLASSASTAQAGASSAQFVPFTGTYAAAAGSYIVAVLYSSSSATAMTVLKASPSATAAQGGFTLPASVTPPTATGNVSPMPACATY